MALLQPKQIICPHCGYDGSIPPAHGPDDEPFRHVEEILVWRPLAGMVGNFADGGLIGVDVSDIYHSGEGYDDGKNPRLECRDCLQFFDIPATTVDVAWVCSKVEFDTEAGIEHVHKPKCDPACKGWVHMQEPAEIQKCDDCGRYQYDDDAVLAHRRDCGCNWPEVMCRNEVPMCDGSMGRCGHALTASENDSTHMECGDCGKTTLLEPTTSKCCNAPCHQCATGAPGCLHCDNCGSVVTS